MTEHHQLFHVSISFIPWTAAESQEHGLLRVLSSYTLK